MQPLKTSATYDDLCDVPELFIAEIVDGDLYASRRPPVLHIYAASVLGAYLGAQFDRWSSGPDGWIMLNKPELHFGGDVLVPDIAGWRRRRLPELPNAAFMTLAPDWVCEVRWPTTETLDRSKLRIYAREGVSHAWLVDPVWHSLEVLSLDSGRWMSLASHEGSARVRAPPFDALEPELGALWV